MNQVTDVDDRAAARQDPVNTNGLGGSEGRPDTTVPGFRLVVVWGPDAGVSFLGAGERAVIGTHESADLVLHDESASLFHCEIAFSTKWTIRDLSSPTGTAVNGVSILVAHLREGASIRVGRTELRFETHADPAPLPLFETPRFGRMVGTSASVRRAFSLLARAASTDSCVLIEGETGTGKEAAAESIHERSPRRARPMVIVDCSAIPAELLESELFGHERGAFTDATNTREGAFEAANGGTIFLDEIGELGLELQPKLLRVLERKHIKRVGTNRRVPVDVRIIAATNKSLRREVEERRFRSDLYYRLAVVEVHLPPLRERMEDIPLLVDDLLDTMSASGTPEGEALRTPEFLEALSKHTWKGNVRELRNYLERCLVLRAKVPLESEPPDPALPDFDQPLKVARARWTRALERRYVEELMRRTEGKVTAAARAAGVDRMYFYRLLWRYGLR